MSHLYSALGGSSSPTLGPINTKSSRVSLRRRTLVFFCTAAVTGILFHLILVGLSTVEAVREAPVVKQWWPIGPPPPLSSDNTKIIYQKEECDEKEVEWVSTNSNGTLESLWPLEKVREMVSKTKGYYARDYSLGLGWNNMRYIIEASLLHAKLLNRTLVLPSFVYARSCEWNIHVCASFATMVNRGDAIGWGEWRNLPEEKQMGWKVPMELMIDLNILREHHSVIMVSEYLRLHDMPTTIEWSNGAWHRDNYHNTPAHVKKPTLFVISNGLYDPAGTVRVDTLEGLHIRKPEAGPVHTPLLELLATNEVIDWESAMSYLRGHGVKVDRSDHELEALLANNGWSTLHTFKGALGMDYLKSVVEPIRQVVPSSRLRGLIEDYDSVNTDVLVLEGETHLNRKPGALRFTSIAARDEFATMVLHRMHPIPSIRALAERVNEKMYALNQGRMWMGGHMRRGDFVSLNWAMEGSLQDHFQRIKGRLENGCLILESLAKEHSFKTFEVPDVTPSVELTGKEPPQAGDLFYLATDERSPEGLAWIKTQGAVLINDLLTPEDRAIVGWPLLITDVLALLEQTVLSHSAYFYAHAMSSVAGGVVNMRAARGADPRSTLID